MKQLVRAMTLLASVVLSGAVATDDAPPPPVSPAGAQADGPNAWSQSRLYPKPELREQIERTKAYLDENRSVVDNEIARLKSEGQLDRRSTSKIRSTLDIVRDTMSGMAEGILAEEQIDGWTARMIAYELGMAADALAEQADQIERELNGPPAGDDRSGDGQSPETVRQRHLAQTLKMTSGLLRSTAQAITRNVR